MLKTTFDFRALSTLQKLFMGAIVLALVAYWGGLGDLVTRWNKQEEYGHGYFIPLISLWFLWERREALKASIGNPSWMGFYCVLAGALGLMLGEVTAIYVLIQFSFLLTMVGLVLVYGGVSLFKLTILPIAFLAFAIPLPYFVGAQLSWRLQILSSQLGVGLLRLFDYSVFLEGNVIDLGTYKLQVVEACSGLRYLYPLLSISFLVAYMYKAKLWARILVFLSAIPITVIMNSLRIAATGVLVEKWGNSMADGFLHYFEGWIIFMVCLGILVLEVHLLEKFGQKRSFAQAVDVPIISPESPSVGFANNLKPLLASTIVLLTALLVTFAISGREEIKPQRASLATFPTDLAGWKAHNQSLGDKVEKYLGVDDYLLADYRHEKQGIINFYVAYYASQRKGVSPHSPQVCMPGGGWVISALDRIGVNVANKPDFYVNRAVINKDGHRQLVYYWFEQRGRHIANEYWMKWYLLKDALVRNRTDGALVRVTTYVHPSETLEAADARIQTFMHQSIPTLDAYVPN